MRDAAVDREAVAASLRTDVAHSARIYDYYLGGKDNFEADRRAARDVMGAFPAIQRAVRANRDFMHRATRYLTGVGVRQFLDIGTGIPTEPNLHQVAQEVAPDSRVVYVDNDPIVLVHARALLVGTPEGRLEYVAADVRNPLDILNAPQLRETFDPARPVAVSLVAVMHFIDDEDDPHGIVDTLVDALPSGSYLVMSHVTADLLPADTVAEGVHQYYRNGIDLKLRDYDDFARFFPRLEIVDPGIVMAHRWRAGIQAPSARDQDVPIYVAVARKP